MLLAFSGICAVAQQGSSSQLKEENQVSNEGPGEPQLKPKFPPGWSISGTTDVLALFDTNPTSSANAVSDTGQRYTGRIDVSRLSRNFVFLSTYIPSCTIYQEFTPLNGCSHNFTQNLRYKTSASTTFEWNTEAWKHPAWAGSALAESTSGALVMAVAGIDELKLISNISSAQTTLKLGRTVDNRSSIYFSTGGGVVQYSHSSSDSLINALTQPNSSTWFGDATAEYQHQLGERKSISVIAAHDFFEFSEENRHRQVGSLSLRYGMKFSNRLGFSITAGPGYMSQQGENAIQPTLDLSIEASRSTTRSVLEAKVEHSYQPGIEAGSLMGWVESISYQRSVSKRWTAGGFGNYQSSSIPSAQGAAPSPAPYVYTVAALAGYRLRRHVTWVANYGYSVQRGAATGSHHIRSQQFTTGLSFEFNNFLRQ